MYLAYKYAKRKYREHQNVKVEIPRKHIPCSDQTQTAPPSNYDPVLDPTRGTTNDDLLTTGTSFQQNTPNGDSRNANPPSSHNSLEGKKKEKQPLTPEEKAEKTRRRKYRWRIIFGLMTPFTLQTLDTTIVASAVTFIAQDFDRLPLLNWIITSFNLNSAAFLPLFAQTSDIFGRLPTLYASILIISFGSLVCTVSPLAAFPLFLLGRALQGIGAAGINICVRTILADKVELAEYAKNWSIFAAASAVSFSVGPVVGGYLTRVSWRWVFGINLPVGVVAAVMTWWVLGGEGVLVGAQALEESRGLGSGKHEYEHDGEGVGDDRGRRRNGGEGVYGSNGGSGGGMMRDTKSQTGRFLLRLATIDYGGQLLFLLGFGLLVLAFTWAGQTYAWDSVEVLVPLVVGVVLTAGWLVYEYGMAPGRFMARVFPIQRAMMPWKVIAHRNIGLLFVVNFTVGAAMFAVMYFMDVYFALVLGHEPDEAGVALLYFLPGLGVGVYMSMFFTNVWPRQTLPCILLGSITSAVGITVLAWAIYTEDVRVIYGLMALTGHGVGMRFNPGALHGLAYFPTMTAQISCLVTFAQPFGGTIALTIMSTVFNNRDRPTPEGHKMGVMWAYISMIPIMWMSVLISMFLGNVYILKESESEGSERGHVVVHGAWLWSIVQGKKLQRVRVSRGNDGEESHGVSSAVSLQNARDGRKPAIAV